MTGEKCEEFRHELEALLKQYKFDWVVTALEEQIRLGKTEVQVVEAITENQLSLPGEPSPLKGSRRTPKDKFLRRVDYTPRERLTLTIDALQRAVVDVGEIGIHLCDFLTKRNLRPSELKFVSEEENLPPKASTIHSMTSRKENFAKLRSLLAQLRREVIKGAN
jgi:hypothetical protein